MVDYALSQLPSKQIKSITNDAGLTAFLDKKVSTRASSDLTLDGDSRTLDHGQEGHSAAVQVYFARLQGQSIVCRDQAEACFCRRSIFPDVLPGILGVSYRRRGAGCF